MVYSSLVHTFFTIVAQIKLYVNNILVPKRITVMFIVIILIIIKMFMIMVVFVMIIVIVTMVMAMMMLMAAIMTKNRQNYWKKPSSHAAHLPLIKIFFYIYYSI